MRKAFQIGTIIVYHVVLLNPSEAPPIPSIELLVLPRATGECPGGSCVVRVDIEPPVVCCERGLGPVGLDKPTLGGPLVRIPQARVDPHGLALGEGHPLCLMVLEYPYWYVVYQEAATYMKSCDLC